MAVDANVLILTKEEIKKENNQIIADSGYTKL